MMTFLAPQKDALCEVTFKRKIKWLKDYDSGSRHATVLCCGKKGVLKLEIPLSGSSVILNGTQVIWEPLKRGTLKKVAADEPPDDAPTP